MPTWLVTAALAFVLREVAAGASPAEEAAVAAKVDQAIADHLPAAMVPAVDALANTVVKDVFLALHDSNDLAKCATDLVAGNFGQALSDLEALLVKVGAGGSTLAAVRASRGLV